MRRSLVISLVGIMAIAAISLGLTFAAGNKPELGLDLQGGASVVLEPDRKVPSGIIDQAIAIIRSRVDALGVAEPDISRQGSSIVVQLPGVKDQDRALEIVGQTAELRLRPVLNQLPPETATTTTTTTTTTSTTVPTETTVAGATTSSTSTTSTTAPIPGTTSREEDKPDQQVVLPELDKDIVTSRYQLGPALATGTIISTANATFNPDSSEWQVDFQTTKSGAKKFDEIAAQCNPPSATCPTGRLAIVLDSVVISAPTIQTANFGGRGQISGSFTQGEAKRLALVLRFGALPVQLEPQTVQRVSATLGKDSLRAGLLAGMVGLALVLLYIILYYRALGVVVVIGLAVSASLLWSIIAFLGATSGLALSLAGATGIIVSVGVTVDSYVVYFERLKDELKSGRTIRSSVDRGFSRAYRTIVAADVSSLIGAGLLYFLTVGPVRGFAFFLGLSTLLDLIVAYFFTRPMVALLAQNRTFTEARWVGVARGLAVTRTGDS